MLRQSKHYTKFWEADLFALLRNIRFKFKYIIIDISDNNHSWCLHATIRVRNGDNGYQPSTIFSQHFCSETFRKNPFHTLATMILTMLQAMSELLVEFLLMSQTLEPLEGVV